MRVHGPRERARNRSRLAGRPFVIAEWARHAAASTMLGSGALGLGQVVRVSSPRGVEMKQSIAARLGGVLAFLCVPALCSAAEAPTLPPRLTFEAAKAQAQK